MSSRKHRPVLYEVVRRSRLNAGRDAARSAAAPARPPTPAVDAPDAPALFETALPAADHSANTPEGAVPAWRGHNPGSESAEIGGGPLASWTAWLAEGKLHLSVGWVGATVVGVAFVLVLFVTFQAGARFAGRDSNAPRDPAAKPDTLAAQPRGADPQSPARPAADISVITPPRPAPTTPMSPPAATPSAPPPSAAVQPTTANEESPATVEIASDAFDFEADAYYLVIQHFHRDQGAAATQAQEFLRSSGVECVLRVGSKDIRLFATRPFRLSGGSAADRKNERTALDDLKRRVKDLGKEYTRTRAKGYAFDQCYELKQ